MDKKHSIFDYLTQVFMIYGITIVLLNIFCLLFGAEAKDFSTIFSLGDKGISIITSFQFLLVIALVVTMRFIFMTDYLIKKMPVAVRIILMFAGAMTVTLIFIFLCGWFPTDNPTAWIMFIVCFAISTIISTFISVLNERLENKKLAEALNNYKKENENG